MSGPLDAKKALGKLDAKPENEAHLQQIEYLLYQSTLGVHFLFDADTIHRILSEPTDEQSFFSLDNMAKVQGLLTTFIEKPTIAEKQSYLNSLPKPEYELIVRAYFHLVENTILANTTIRH